MLLKKWKRSVLYSSFSTFLCSLSVPQHAVVHAALQQGYDKSFCFPLQQFCATSLLSADSPDLALDPPGIRQKDCPTVKRQTSTLRDRIPLYEVPVAYWIKQSGKVFSWCSALTLPVGAKTLQCPLHWSVHIWILSLILLFLLSFSPWWYLV